MSVPKNCLTDKELTRLRSISHNLESVIQDGKTAVLWKALDDVASDVMNNYDAVNPGAYVLRIPKLVATLFVAGRRRTKFREVMVRVFKNLLDPDLEPESELEPYEIKRYFNDAGLPIVNEPDGMEKVFERTLNQLHGGSIYDLCRQEKLLKVATWNWHVVNKRYAQYHAYQRFGDSMELRSPVLQPHAC